MISIDATDPIRTPAPAAPSAPASRPNVLESSPTNDPAQDLEAWLAAAAATNQFRVITGGLGDRATELDEYVDAAHARDIPVVRLDGRNPSEWSASLTAQLGPLSVRFDFTSTPGTTEPTPTPAPDTAPVPVPTPGAVGTPLPSAVGTPLPGATGTALPGITGADELGAALDRFRDLAREQGGILIVVDDLHRAPAAARDQLFDAVQQLDGAVLVAGSDRSSAADLDRAFSRAQPTVDGIDRSAPQCTAFATTAPTLATDTPAPPGPSLAG